MNLDTLMRMVFSDLEKNDKKCSNIFIDNACVPWHAVKLDNPDNWWNIIEYSNEVLIIWVLSDAKCSFRKIKFVTDEGDIRSNEYGIDSEGTNTYKIAEFFLKHIKDENDFLLETHSGFKINNISHLKYIIRNCIIVNRNMNRIVDVQAFRETQGDKGEVRINIFNGESVDGI